MKSLPQSTCVILKGCRGCLGVKSLPQSSCVILKNNPGTSTIIQKIAVLCGEQAQKVCPLTYPDMRVYLFWVLRDDYHLHWALFRPCAHVSYFGPGSFVSHGLHLPLDRGAISFGRRNTNEIIMQPQVSRFSLARGRISKFTQSL